MIAESETGSRKCRSALVASNGDRMEKKKTARRSLTMKSIATH